MSAAVRTHGVSHVIRRNIDIGIWEKAEGARLDEGRPGENPNQQRRRADRQRAEPQWGFVRSVRHEGAPRPGAKHRPSYDRRRGQFDCCDGLHGEGSVVSAAGVQAALLADVGAAGRFRVAPCAVGLPLFAAPGQVERTIQARESLFCGKWEIHSLRQSRGNDEALGGMEAEGVEIGGSSRSRRERDLPV